MMKTWNDFKKELFTEEELRETERIVNLEVRVYDKPKGRKRTISNRIEKMIARSEE